MQRRDFWGLGAVAAAIAALVLFRYYVLEPRVWGALCVQAQPPLACLPRGGLIWLQGHYLMGTGSLALGIYAFAWRGGFAAQLAAVILGAAAIENYNATWGAIGLALGAWSWLRRDSWNCR
jgi:hypothetical protein